MGDKILDRVCQIVSEFEHVHFAPALLVASAVIKADYQRVRASSTFQIYLTVWLQLDSFLPKILNTVPLQLQSYNSTALLLRFICHLSSLNGSTPHFKAHAALIKGMSADMSRWIAANKKAPKPIQMGDERVVSFASICAFKAEPLIPSILRQFEDIEHAHQISSLFSRDELSRAWTRITSSL